VTFGAPAVKKEENAKGIADAAIATFFSFLRKLIVSPSLFNFLKWKMFFCPLPLNYFIVSLFMFMLKICEKTFKSFKSSHVHIVGASNFCNNPIKIVFYIYINKTSPIFL